MIDKYDVFYGISDQAKQKVYYWINSLFFSMVLLFWFKDKQGFFHLGIPFTMKGVFLFILSLFVLGLLLYAVVLIIIVLADIIQFKRKEKKLFIKTRTLNNQQKDKIAKKIFMRKEIYEIILNPTDNHLTKKQWKYYTKKLGTKKEILSRMKFLNYLVYKIKEEEPLKGIEIDYLNDMLFSKEDIHLVKKIQKDMNL